VKKQSMVEIELHQCKPMVMWRNQQLEDVRGGRVIIGSVAGIMMFVNLGSLWKSGCKRSISSSPAPSFPSSRIAF